MKMQSLRVATWSTWAIMGIALYSVTTAFAPEFWSVTIPQAALFALGIAWAVWLLRRPETLTFGLAAAVPALLALFGLLQITLHRSQYPFATELSCLAWASAAVMAFVAQQCSRQAEHRDRILAALCYLGGVLSVISIAGNFTSHFRVFWFIPVQYERVFGPYVYRNHFAAFAELVLAPCLFLAVRRRGQRAFFASVAALLLAAVVVSESRAGVILCVAEMLAVLAIVARRGLLPARSFWLFAVAVSVGVVAAAGMVGWDGVVRRFHERNAYHVRWEIVRSSLDMVRDHPFFGNGLGTWRVMYPTYARIDPGVIVNEAHNDWVQLACDAGVGGFVLAVVLFGWCLRRGLRSIWGLGTAFVLMHALIDYPLAEPSLTLLILLLAGMMCNAGPRPAFRTRASIEVPRVIRVEAVECS